MFSFVPGFSLVSMFVRATVLHVAVAGLLLTTACTCMNRPQSRNLFVTDKSQFFCFGAVHGASFTFPCMPCGNSAAYANPLDSYPGQGGAVLCLARVSVNEGMEKDRVNNGLCKDGV